MEHEQPLPGMEEYVPSEPQVVSELGVENGNDHVHDEKLEPLVATTAFLVVCLPDGTKTAYSDVNIPIVLEREVTLNDMYDGCGQVMRDIQTMQLTSQITNSTINGVVMALDHKTKQAEAQQLADKLRSQGIHLPS